MKTQNIFFGNNIKFLRERKTLSQKSMAEKLGISRSKVNGLENAHIDTPKIIDCIHFSNFFKVSIDSLIKVDLSKLPELKLRELEAGNDVYMMGGNIRVLAITVDKDEKENMEYVPIKAKAGYKAGYNDPQFIASLPKFSMPNMPKNGTFRMFPTKGDSMLPIPENCDVIAQYIEDWKNIKPKTLCIVILKGDQDFVFKQVSFLENGVFLLESFNAAYPPYQVAAEDILEIWKFRSYQTETLPEAESDMQQVMKALKELKSEIEYLKK